MTQAETISTPPIKTHQRTIMIVAGEASGDKHGAALARALVKLFPETEFTFFGSGGEEMRAAGVETLVDAREVAIIGIPEIIGALGKLYGAFRKLIHAARIRKPDAVVLVDWPDFNMRVAKKLHREGCKIIYYISPQVWAWRRYRVNALKRDVDKMLVILPFEEAFYKNQNIDVEYIGHPLVEAVRLTLTREAFASQHGLDASRPFIALLPGSRHKEIHYHLPEMLKAARQLNAPQFILPLASTVSRETIEKAIKDSGVEVTIIERDTYNALGHAAFAVVASGTATVETALAGTPMVIVYRGSEINWRLIRPLIQLDTFGMVNLIAGRRIMPELIQHDCTGERIAETVQEVSGDSRRLMQMREDLAEVRRKLETGEGSVPERAARAVMRLIDK
ncbi:MAG: lipid-A-disaccharide synthase [Acidobacteriota bacterium]